MFKIINESYFLEKTKNLKTTKYIIPPKPSNRLVAAKLQPEYSERNFLYYELEDNSIYLLNLQNMGLIVLYSDKDNIDTSTIINDFLYTNTNISVEDWKIELIKETSDFKLFNYRRFYYESSIFDREGNETKNGVCNRVVSGGLYRISNVRTGYSIEFALKVVNFYDISKDLLIAMEDKNKLEVNFHNTVNSIRFIYNILKFLI